MENFLLKMFESGELSLSVFVGVFMVWFIRSFWPGYVARTQEKSGIEKELRERELAMEERLREKEIDANRESQMLIVKELAHVKISIDSMHATFNDFLQNLLSQYMEERRELIDTGAFRGSDRKNPAITDNKTR